MRLHEVNSGNGSSFPKIRSTTNKRFAFTANQIKSLNGYYHETSKYITREERLKLSETLNIPEKHIGSWFGNRRRKKDVHEVKNGVANINEEIIPPEILIKEELSSKCVPLTFENVSQTNGFIEACDSFIEDLNSNGNNEKNAGNGSRSPWVFENGKVLIKLKRQIKMQSREILVNATNNTREYKLPYDWSKKLTRRRTGKETGRWDVYIYSPEKKKFRSNLEIQTYIRDHPEVEYDPESIKIQKPKDDLYFFHDQKSVNEKQQDSTAILERDTQFENDKELDEKFKSKREIETQNRVHPDDEYDPDEKEKNSTEAGAILKREIILENEKELDEKFKSKREIKSNIMVHPNDEFHPESIKIQKPKADPFFFRDQKSRDNKKQNSTEAEAILKKGVKFQNEKELDEDYILSNFDSDKEKMKNRNRSLEKVKNSGPPIIMKFTRSCIGHKSLGPLYKSQIR